MLLDFSKAFDNINHEILFKKREFYGIRGIANQWFSSHLSNSLHSYSTVNGVTSIPVNISCMRRFSGVSPWTDPFLVIY